MSDSPGNGAGKADAPQGPPPTIEADGLLAMYANFVRVSGTPEELILDFGLNSQPTGTPTNPIHITQRLALNHYTAKRLWLTLGAALQRHEQIFGVVEIDINKRVLPTTRPTAPR